MTKRSEDFTSVSPSAKSLLMMKGYTTIPFAKQTAALMQGPEVFDLDFEGKDLWFWMRVMHFENRYWSIDQLLKQTDSRNILELSSGYSLRGLDLCINDAGLHYIDTDLPDVVALKKAMIAELHLDEGVKGRFRLASLNAMDESAFRDLVSRFEEGSLTIVNEGLLMYLDLEEKKRLCKTIYNILKERDGCWITADIYVRRDGDIVKNLPQSKSEAVFFEQHHIEENKFESYEGAAEFFREQGFEIIKEAVSDYRNLSVMPHLLKALPPQMRDSKEPPPKIQATWMLKAL